MCNHVKLDFMNFDLIFYLFMGIQQRSKTPGQEWILILRKIDVFINFFSGKFTGVSEAWIISLMGIECTAKVRTEKKDILYFKIQYWAMLHFPKLQICTIYCSLFDFRMAWLRSDCIGWGQRSLPTWPPASKPLRYALFPLSGRQNSKKWL